jgi:hypothetical protein
MLEALANGLPTNGVDLTSPSSSHLNGATTVHLPVRKLEIRTHFQCSKHVAPEAARPISAKPASWWTVKGGTTTAAAAAAEAEAAALEERICSPTTTHVALSLDSNYMRGLVALVNSINTNAACPESIFYHFPVMSMDEVQVKPGTLEKRSFAHPSSIERHHVTSYALPSCSHCDILCAAQGAGGADVVLPAAQLSHVPHRQVRPVQQRAPHGLPLARPGEPAQLRAHLPARHAASLRAALHLSGHGYGAASSEVLMAGPACDHCWTPSRSIASPLPCV